MIRQDSFLTGSLAPAPWLPAPCPAKRSDRRSLSWAYRANYNPRPTRGLLRPTWAHFYATYYSCGRHIRSDFTHRSAGIAVIPVSGHGHTSGEVVCGVHVLTSFSEHAGTTRCLTSLIPTYIIRVTSSCTSFKYNLNSIHCLNTVIFRQTAASLSPVYGTHDEFRDCRNHFVNGSNTLVHRITFP